MKSVFVTIIFCSTLSFCLRGQGTDLHSSLQQATQELVNVDTEKYRYEQSLEYDAGKPWRVSFNIVEVNLKNDKSESHTFYLNLADLDPRLINIETDKEEQLVVMKCRRRENFIRLTDGDGDVSYDSELQLWSPEIDKATALRDLFRQAAVLAEEAWKADFSPGSSLQDLGQWLEENVVSVEIAGAGTTVEWVPDPQLSDLVSLTVISDDGEDITTYKFSLGDLSVSNLQLEVKKESVSVTAGTVNKANLICEEREGAVSGYEKSVAIPVNGIEEAGRLIQVLEAALPLARKLRETRMPAPQSLTDALQQLSELVTGARRVSTEITAIVSPAPLAKLDLNITDTEKGDSKTESYVFDFGDLNARKIELRVKGVALDVTVETIKNQDFIQKWEDEEESGFDDEITFPVNSIEAGHKLAVLLPYIIDEAGKIPVPLGDFNLIELAIKTATTEDVSQTIEQRQEDCKWRFREEKEGKKPTEILYEFNLYDLDPKQVSYEVTNKGIFLQLLTLRKEETINLYENNEPRFTNTMVWRLNSLSEAKQLRVTMIKLIKDCTE